MNVKKCLVVSSVSSMIGQFIVPDIELLLSMGYDVTVAANFSFGNTFKNTHAEKLWDTLKGNNVEIYNVKFVRNVFDVRNIVAYKQIKKIINENNYTLVHCHSPVGGVVTRLAIREKHLINIRVIYTAHGFHFYKGAPFVNWLFYYPIERWLSKYTDALITMNGEDYELAKLKMKAKYIYNVHGVGVDVAKFSISKAGRNKRAEFNMPMNSTVIISVGELIKRKNHQVAIRAISEIKSNNIYYIICGQGGLKDYLLELCKKVNMEHCVLFLDYRDDITDLLHMSDVFLFPSLQEGLSVALMEAMAAGLPCVTSNIRGNVDLIVDKEGGFLCGVNNTVEYKDAIERIIEDKNLKLKMGEYNRNILKKFDMVTVMKQMKNIYERK